ncbi:cupin domain-containing protein [Halioglobus maricola]|uniref:Cupin domain-containing protein n=1 Tax=Halioglobus maricola TaxID=2601894 RepID=A0A5P9NM84_9GAMM|nr:cupin domain-containing protein [Halioglobus maricola]QFU76038.1 cupin domain-containing protein [Halioglobus maricola]
MKKLLLTALCLVSPLATAEPILKATTSWDEGAIAYPQGQAEITSIILRIEEGQEPPFHCHPVPTMGYMLKGKIRVDTKEGKSVELSAGDPLVEVMNTVHRGVALEGPAEIVVFYAGAEGVPVTVKPEDDPNGKYCKP